MWTNKQFWLDASWRAFRTFCQSLAALLGGQAVNLLAAPWSNMIGIAGTAGLVSLLMSVDRERAVVWTAGTTAADPVSSPAEPISAAVEAAPLEAGYAPGCGIDLR